MPNSFFGFKGSAQNSLMHVCCPVFASDKT